MKKFLLLLTAAALLIAAVGCGTADETTEPRTETVVTEPTSAEPLPTERKLVPMDVEDLQNLLSDLKLTGATLTHLEKETHVSPADAAIRAQGYVNALKNYTWELYQPYTTDDSGIPDRYIFSGGGITMTAYQSYYDGSYPFRVTTDDAEGWFQLTAIRADASGQKEQSPWMLYDTFESWYHEAELADLHTGEGMPITAEELDMFTDFTANQSAHLDEESGTVCVSAEPISCFFTSDYSDPRDMDAEAFLCYCPGTGLLGAADEEEFKYVQEKLDWRDGNGELLPVGGMPCRRLPHSYVNELLTEYAGITVEDMHTDWFTEAFYIPETDCFYSFSSDFGPGSFTPCYGEKDGDIVTLWEYPSGYDKPIGHVLTLKNNGDRWLIVSHTAAD